MEERPQKLRKLQQLRSEVPYVTKSALEGILTWVQKNGPVPLATAKHMREANRATLAAASAYGPVLLEQKVKMQDGSTMSMPFLNFHSFLHAAYKAGGALFDLLKEVTEPLGLCLYSDEVCPGNPLSGATPRKCWVVYCGLVQTKQHLQNERAWVTLCCLRTSIVSKVEAGMSQILKIILKMIFQSEQADVLDMGILLQGPPGCPDGYERKRLKMCLSFVVQDGQAHKQCWSLKGDSGSRFCGLCKNVFSHNEEEEGISEVSKWTCFKNLDLNSCEEIFSSWDRMAARSGNMSAQDFKTWQQASGITFSNEAILADVSLRNILKPTQQYKHDWMHCLMSNGVLSQGVYHMLEEMDAWKEFHGYIAGWKIPSHWQHAGINVVNLFTEKRIAKHRNSEKFNSTASELLTILPIFCYFLQKVCRAMLQAEAQCIRKLALLVELLQATWFTSIDADAIQRCAEESLVLWNQTNWKMIKKHHWLLHLGEAYRKHKIMVACWTMERKHRFVSQIGAAIANTRQLEQSMMEEVTAKELQSLGNGVAFATIEFQLQKPHKLPNKFAATVKHVWPHVSLDMISTSKTAWLKYGASCSQGDVVLLKTNSEASKWDCGKIHLHLSCAGQAIALVSLFSLKQLGEQMEYAVWEDTATKAAAVPLQHVFTPVVYASSGQSVTTLVPLPWR